MGLDRFELSTSRLSGVRSNQLSYRPARLAAHLQKDPTDLEKIRVNRRPIKFMGIDLRDATLKKAEYSLERR